MGRSSTPLEFYSKVWKTAFREWANLCVPTQRVLIFMYLFAFKIDFWRIA